LVLVDNAIDGSDATLIGVIIEDVETLKVERVVERRDVQTRQNVEASCCCSIAVLVNVDDHAGYVSNSINSAWVDVVSERKVSDVDLTTNALTSTWTLSDVNDRVDQEV